MVIFIAYNQYLLRGNAL